MARELVYTSAHRGLKPGTRGFCTVAHTNGMRTPLIRLLESLSAYKSPFAGQHVGDMDHPTAISHHRGFVSGESFSILSRVGYAGRDFTNRDNKLAYHLVLDPRERPPAGPAWLARQDGVLIDRWEKEPQIIPEHRTLPNGDLPANTVASHWEELTGDAGWAGALVREFTRNPAAVIYLIYEPGMEMLPLIEDVTAILPAPKRWLLTFNTFFTHLPAGLNCTVRCCLPDTAPLKDARATAGAVKMDLTQPMGEAPDNIYVRIARGEDVSPPQRNPVRRRKSKDTDADKSKAAKDFVLLKNRTRKRLRMRPDDPDRKGSK